MSHLISAHYLHRWPGVVVATLALMDAGLPIGAIVFAIPPRETLIRYGVTVAWELARLFIVDNTPKNTETWFVARSIRWIRREHPEVQLLVSYADPSANHRGTIYRAGNWICDGVTDAGRKTPRFDYVAVLPASTTDALFDLGSAETVKFSRAAHVPTGVEVQRLPRVSKYRFVYWLDGKQEARRQHVAKVSER